MSKTELVVTLNEDGLRQFTSDHGDTGRWLDRVAERVRDEGAQTAPRGKTGDLKRAHKVRSAGTLAREIAAETAYAIMVHDGTRAHLIRPRRRQALRFEVAGEVIFTKKVSHPGTTANPWLDKALTRVVRSL